MNGLSDGTDGTRREYFARTRVKSCYLGLTRAISCYIVLKNIMEGMWKQNLRLLGRDRELTAHVLFLKCEWRMNRRLYAVSGTVYLIQFRCVDVRLND